MNYDNRKGGFHRLDNFEECGLIPATKKLMEKMNIKNTEVVLRPDNVVRIVKK